mgnify:CR=1 FL=1
MALEKISLVQGTAVYVRGDDIDTDRIIPARFMKCVTFDGLGEYLFYDVRFDENGESKDHPLNDPSFSSASILLSGSNFGCGSSREHAPQSIYRAGFRAVIAGNFAEIFFGNSTNLGIPCVCMDEEARNELASLIERNPSCSLSLDLINYQVRSSDQSWEFEIREGARDSLINGTWDSLDELLGNRDLIDGVSSRLPYV